MAKHPGDDLYEVQMDDFPEFQLEYPEIEMTGGDLDLPASIQDAIRDDDTPENAYLSGNRQYVISSNVEYFQYFMFYEDGSPQNVLYVGFKDGSLYSYQDVSMEEALVFYRAVSPGGAVWDHLRVRGTVFGYQKPYALVTGNRVWHAAGNASQLRHGAIPRTGEPYKGYTPHNNYFQAKGPMGPNTVNLGKKRGKKKIQAFTPTFNLGRGAAG